MSHSSQIIKDFGAVTVQGVSVTKTPAALVADAAVMTTVGANTGTSGAGLSLIGDTSSVNQAAAIMADFKALQEDVAALRTTLNLALARLRTYGVITV